jgi:glycerol-3-phosphate acyltransferase PlsY
MTDLPLLCLVAASSYFVGAIPFGWIVARWRGHDILREGSGNIGATNVARVVGLPWGVLVFALDFGKGALPVGLASLIPPPADTTLYPETFPVTAGVAAFLGHLLPIYLGFRGGKGVATGAGVVAILVPPITAIVLLAWGVILAVTRYVSIASMFAATLLFVLRLFWVSEPWNEKNLAVTAFCAAGAALVVVRHHSNIRNLIQGTEHRLGSR